MSNTQQQQQHLQNSIKQPKRVNTTSENNNKHDFYSENSFANKKFIQSANSNLNSIYENSFLLASGVSQPVSGGGGGGDHPLNLSLNQKKSRKSKYDTNRFHWREK